MRARQHACGSLLPNRGGTDGVHRPPFSGVSRVPPSVLSRVHGNTKWTSHQHHYTYSPVASSRAISIAMLVASDDATSGSVIAKQDLILPSSKGTNHLSRCSLDPYLARTSILPVSGEVQLVAWAANSAGIEVPLHAMTREERHGVAKHTHIRYLKCSASITAGMRCVRRVACCTGCVMSLLHARDVQNLAHFCVLPVGQTCAQAWSTACNRSAVDWHEQIPQTLPFRFGHQFDQDRRVCPLVPVLQPNLFALLVKPKEDRS